MDKSKECIKMCEKAFKHIGVLQPDGLPNIFIFKKPHKHASDFLLGNDKPDKNIGGQLYRQDQLQEIIMVNGNLTVLMQVFWRYLSNEFDLAWSKTSMEQLWLAFVMKKKCNRVWSGEKWIIAP